MNKFFSNYLTSVGSFTGRNILTGDLSPLTGMAFPSAPLRTIEKGVVFILLELSDSWNGLVESFVT